MNTATTTTSTSLNTIKYLSRRFTTPTTLSFKFIRKELELIDQEKVFADSQCFVLDRFIAIARYEYIKMHEIWHTNLCNIRQSSIASVRKMNIQF